MNLSGNRSECLNVKPEARFFILPHESPMCSFTLFDV